MIFNFDYSRNYHVEIDTIDMIGYLYKWVWDVTTFTKISIADYLTGCFERKI